MAQVLRGAVGSILQQCLGGGQGVSQFHRYTSDRRISIEIWKISS